MDAIPANGPPAVPMPSASSLGGGTAKTVKATDDGGLPPSAAVAAAAATIKTAAPPPLRPTADVDAVLSSYLLPPNDTIGTADDDNSSWRNLDPIQRALHAPQLPLLSRRPPRWSSKFDVGAAVRTAQVKGGVVRAAFDAAGLAALRAAMFPSPERVPGRVDEKALATLPMPPIVDAVNSVSAARNRCVDSVLGKNKATMKGGTSSAGGTKRGRSPVPSDGGGSAPAAKKAKTSALGPPPPGSGTTSPIPDGAVSAAASGAAAGSVAAMEALAAIPTGDSTAAVAATTTPEGKDPKKLKKKKKKKRGGGAPPAASSGGCRSPTPTAASSPASSDAGAAPTASQNWAASATTAAGGYAGAMGGVDSRSTASRAILCAAGSVAYSELTPDYDEVPSTSGKEGAGAAAGGGKIDVLDIPQNTHMGGELSDLTEGGATTTLPTSAASAGGGGTADDDSASATCTTTTINMGAVLMQAQVYGKRAVNQALGAAARADKRRNWRVGCALRIRALEVCTTSKLPPMLREEGGEGNNGEKEGWMNGLVAPTQPPLLGIGNPFALTSNGTAAPRWVSDDDEEDIEDRRRQAIDISRSSGGRSAFDRISSAPAPGSDVDRSAQIVAASRTDQWSGAALPRLKSVLRTGAGHAILHDLMWGTRAGRIADLLRSVATMPAAAAAASSAKEGGREAEVEEAAANYGPHLIITTRADLHLFAKAFAPMQRGLERRHRPDDGGPKAPPTPTLRALIYRGGPAHRRSLRLRHFPSFASSQLSLPTSPYHVIVTTYADFLADYCHLTRLPYQCCVLDDGMAFMGLAYHDPNGNLGKAWEGMWSKGDGGAGGAGVGIGASGAVGDTTALTDDGWDWGSDDGGGGVGRSAKDGGKDAKASGKGDSSGGSSGGGSSGKGGGDAKAAARPTLLGLTARHRLLLAPTLSATYRGTPYAAPVPALLQFLSPQFADVVREEWDRSRIVNCRRSMGHFRRLVSRGVVVHVPPKGSSRGDAGGGRDLMTLALNSVNGQLPLAAGAGHGMDEFAAECADEFGGGGGAHPHRAVPSTTTTEHLISAGLLTPSRRHATAWLRLGSPLRTELSAAPLATVLAAIKARAKAGFTCEEIVTASSITSSGAGGGVLGPAAYRLAVRCGRTFGSEQGLRQHCAAMHAPPGTWLCRTCGGDCGTSQARTHHERTCGHAAAAGAAPDAAGGGEKGGKAGGVNTGGGIPTVGQGVGSTAGGKRKPGVPGSSGQGDGRPPEKDPDGSFRVPGYRGVWVNPAGKHFVKISDVRLTEEVVKGAGAATKEEGQDGTEKQESDGVDVANQPIVQLFDTADQAAKVHDAVAKHRSLTVELNYKPDGTRITYEDNFGVNAAGGPGLEVLGGGTSSVVPALSVINIRDLPPNVKPLLRDPRQTSRTGGNQKRYVYAYRGVCRQARKGHDRWQSQISFGGTNHYLGTFDSEWDAAAIYAWAHLILYGEEATAKAQKEGEEAAAAYEQEKKDIAAGKIIVPVAKPSKKKKKKKKKKPAKGEEEKVAKKADAASSDQDSKMQLEKVKTSATSPPKDSAKQSTGKKPHKKRPLKANVPTPTETTSSSILKKQSTAVAPDAGHGIVLAPAVQTVSKAPLLTRRKEYAEKDDNALLKEATVRILALRDKRLNETVSSATIRKLRGWSVCVPIKDIEKDPVPSGTAMLIGLDAADFGWDVNFFLLAVQQDLGVPTTSAFDAIDREYGKGGYNASFRTVLQTSTCTIGRAGRYLEEASVSLGLGPVDLGGSAGNIECNIGGLSGACSESAARISYCPVASVCEYQFEAIGDDGDIVTLNGARIKKGVGSYPLKDGDICSVGTRVFVFLVAPK